MSAGPTLVMRLKVDPDPGATCDSVARGILGERHRHRLLDSKWATPEPEWVARGGGWGPLAPRDSDGIWVATYTDRSAAVAFGSELDALRAAVSRQMDVTFRPFGADIFTGAMADD